MKTATQLRTMCNPLLRMLLVASSILFYLQSAQAVAYIPTREHALWIFADPANLSNPISNAVSRQSLIADSVASKVTTLYLSVYRSTIAQPTNSVGRLMYEEADIADLITKAHANRIKVYAAYGAPDWPAFGCDLAGFPLQRLSEIVAYNTTNTAAKFDGIILDVEPPAPPATIITESDYIALLTQYQCFQNQAAQYSIELAVAIRFGWKDAVIYNGVNKAFYKHVINMIQVPNWVVVMGSRDFAGTSNPLSDGIIASDQNQISYARSINKHNMILAGLETSNPASVGILSKETFYEEGQSSMNGAAQAVLNYFGYFSGFGGFAVHNYGSSYLSGTSSNWPTINYNFPSAVNSVQEIFTPPGSPVTVTPSGMINGANVILTFPSVSNTSGSVGYTYVLPLDTAGIPSLPSNYLLVNGLAFDISTTANFSGPVTVCFSNMNVAATDFSSLRVLHYTSNMMVDETILTGANAPNGSTRTLCASVTSFSPFVIAKCVAKNDIKNRDKSGKDDKKCRKPELD